MSLESKAQELVVVEPKDLEESSNYIPLNVFEGDCLSPFEVSEGEPDSVIIVIDDIPGAPKGTKLPDIEVVEEKEDEDKLDAKPAVVRTKWDWSGLAPKDFYIWAKTTINGVPPHSGYDSAGIERAIAYLERLDNEISKAMRQDIDGNLDANIIEQIRSQIDLGKEKLSERNSKINDTKKGKKKKADQENGLTKEAQKIAGVNGVMVTVPLLISRIARVCINGVVSAGHNLEETFKAQSERYKLSDREEAEVLQLLEDMGYALRYDRGHNTDTYDQSSSDNFDFSAQYRA